MNPISLIAMGLGTAGNLYSGIKSIAEAPARKRRFLNDAQRDAQLTALRNARMTDFFPTNALDAMHKKAAVTREARENPAFQGDPAALLPFVQSATELAGGIYDYATEPPNYQKAIDSALEQPDVDEIRDAPKIPEPSYLQYMDRAQPERQIAYSDPNYRRRRYA